MALERQLILALQEVRLVVMVVREVTLLQRMTHLKQIKVEDIPQHNITHIDSHLNKLSIKFLNIVDSFQHIVNRCMS